MKEIGNILKERREELGYTLEDMSVKTKIAVRNLRALEEGDIEYFKDDISYIRYFVRFYCQALTLDYEPIREKLTESIDKYTETEALIKVQENEQIQENINKRIKTNTTTVRLQKRKIDYSLISLLVVIGIMVIIICYAGIKYLPQMFNGEPTPTKTPDVIFDVTPSPTIDSSLVVDDKPVSNIYVEEENSTNYIIKGFNENEQVSLVVKFGSETWTRVLINDVVTDNPKTDIYKADEKIEVLVNAQNELKVTIHLGKVQSNIIEINGVAVALNESVSNLTRGQQIHFTFKGE